MITRKTLKAWRDLLLFLDALTAFSFSVAIVLADSWFDVRGTLLASLVLFGIGVSAAGLSTKVRQLRRLRLDEMKQYRKEVV